ncbi:Sacsin [Manis pentadactyla]|nr:Sacsin [Manis pentadactyla]
MLSGRRLALGDLQSPDPAGPSMDAEQMDVEGSVRGPSDLGNSRCTQWTLRTCLAFGAEEILECYGSRMTEPQSTPPTGTLDFTISSLQSTRHIRKALQSSKYPIAGFESPSREIGLFFHMTDDAGILNADDQELGHSTLDVIFVTVLDLLKLGESTARPPPTVPLGIQAADKAGMGLGGTPGWVGTRGWVRMAGWVFILLGRLQSVPLCPCAPALMLWANSPATRTASGIRRFSPYRTDFLLAGPALERILSQSNAQALKKSVVSHAKHVVALAFTLSQRKPEPGVNNSTVFVAWTTAFGEQLSQGTQARRQKMSMLQSLRERTDCGHRRRRSTRLTGPERTDSMDTFNRIPRGLLPKFLPKTATSSGLRSLDILAREL